MSDTFTCELCHQTFEKVRPEGEVMREYRDNFGADAVDEKTEVCTDCYLEFMRWYANEKKEGRA